MSTVQEHYDRLLAPIYVWMAGGMESALAAGAQDVAQFVPGRGLALDLGAGFGMHAIPLARGGYEVVALDTSAELLDALREHGLDRQICGWSRQYQNRPRPYRFRPFSVALDGGLDPYPNEAMETC